MSRRSNQNPVSLFSFQDIITSMVGIVLLITLILILQLMSQMSAAPPTPTRTVQELRQQIAEMQPVLTELQDALAELYRVREQSEVFTPSQERTDALQSTVDRLETNVAAAEKKIDEIKKRIDELQNSPAFRKLTETQQEIDALAAALAGLQQQTKQMTDDAAALQAKIQELKAKNTALDQQIANNPALKLTVTVPQESDKMAFILDYGQGTITVIPTDGSPQQKFSSRSQFSSWVSRRDYQKEHFVVYVRPSRFGQYEDIIKELRAKGFDVGLQVIGEKADLSLGE
jgi:phage shock protein A